MSDYESDASSVLVNEQEHENQETQGGAGGAGGAGGGGAKTKDKRPRDETPAAGGGSGASAKKARPKPEWPVMSTDTINTLKEQRWTLDKIRTILRHDKEVLLTLFHKRQIPDADVATLISYVAKE